MAPALTPASLSVLPILRSYRTKEVHMFFIPVDGVHQLEVLCEHELVYLVMVQRVPDEEVGRLLR